MFRHKISLFVLPFMAMVSLQANDPFGDDIFQEMYQMQQEMDKVFERMQKRMQSHSRSWHYPSGQSLLAQSGMTNSNMIEDKGTYYAYNTQIPENKHNQIDVNIEEGILHLKASVSTVTHTNQSNMRMQQQSMRMMQRSEPVPNDADINTLKGEYVQGLFVLTLQKKKSVTHPTLKKKETLTKPSREKNVTQTPNVEKVKETEESNATKIRVPHTSSQV